MEDTERRHWFYFVVLPLLWGVVCLVGLAYPGDEYGLWAISSIAGLWAPMALNSFVHLSGNLAKYVMLGSMVLAGLGVMFAAGYAMDRYRVRKLGWTLSWLVPAAAIFALAIGAYPSVEKALSKNGSWTAYVCFAANLGLTLSIPLSLVATALGRLRKRPDPVTD